MDESMRSLRLFPEASQRRRVLTLEEVERVQAMWCPMLLDACPHARLEYRLVGGRMKWWVYVLHLGPGTPQPRPVFLRHVLAIRDDPRDAVMRAIEVVEEMRSRIGAGGRA